MNKLIGITGRKSVGKSCAADYLFNEYDYYRRAFADSLKNGAMEIFGLSIEQVDGDEKEEIDKYWKISSRLILQKFGTEVMREKLVECIPELEWIKDKIWVHSFNKWYINFHIHHPNVGVVISDCRYVNEYEFVKKNGGIIWKIERPGLDNSDRHKSENQDIPYDKLIINDGTIEDLYNKIKGILK